MINRHHMLHGLLVLLALGALTLQQPVTARNIIATAPPTNTKRPTISAVPTTSTVVLIKIPARLCPDCQRVRLRSSPGTAGQILDFLDANTEMFITGRTSDNQWIKVELTDRDGFTGWISAQFARLSNGAEPTDAELNKLTILDAAIDASPTPTSAFNIPSWLYGLSGNARAVFLKGQSMGNRANVFSRVGDSITFSSYFLVPIGQGRYSLGTYGSLSGVIQYFSQANARDGNSFANPPIAAGGGWSAFTLLLPGYSNPDLCGQDSPLVCEYKLVKPSVALIMVGTNDSGSGSAADFGAALKEIVQTSINMGVIPVLITIPPKRLTEEQAQRVNRFNQMIKTTAQQFDVPLWDYWAEMQKAPNQGMSEDGLHPSIPPDGATTVFDSDHLQYGYTIRNLMALEVLDALWRLVLS